MTYAILRTFGKQDFKTKCIGLMPGWRQDTRSIRTSRLEIGLNQPFGRLRVIRAKFVEFTIEEDNCELPAKSLFNLMMEAASNNGGSITFYFSLPQS